MHVLRTMLGFSVGSEGVPEANRGSDTGVTEAAVQVFKKFVQQVAATAPMAKKKDTHPQSLTTQRALRRSRRHLHDGPVLPPSAAAVPAPDTCPP